MEQTERDLRFKMQHIGDIFVDTLENLMEGLKTSFKGVSLTYEIHYLQNKKKKVVCRIGERVVEIRKSDPTVGVATDDQAIKLFSEFDKIEERLEAGIMERESRVNRWRFMHECAE